MYNAGDYIPDRSFDFDRLHEIRDSESERRNAMARKEIEKLKEEREKKGLFSPRDPVLVSRNMKHLPKPGIK